MTPMDKETYLGDGLYASYDGWQICLRAPRAIASLIAISILANPGSSRVMSSHSSRSTRRR